MKAFPSYLLTLAVFAALCLTSTRGQDASPVSAPTLSPAGTAAPTGIKCPDEADAVSSCFGNRTLEDGCARCVIQFWPETVSACVDLVDGTCIGFTQCECGTCVDEVTTYIACLSECDVVCDVPATSPTSSPAPTLTNPCPDEYQAFNDCVDPTNGGKVCEDCVTTFWPDPPVSSCKEIDDETCTGLASCDCNGCDSELLTYLTCLTTSGNQSCSFDCTDTAPSAGPPSDGGSSGGTSCDDEQASIATCIIASGFDSPLACAECLAALTNTTDTCTELQTGLCTGLQQCNCGDCETEILAGLACTIPVCNLNRCDGTEPSDPPASNPSPGGGNPAPSPGGGSLAGGGNSPTAGGGSGSGPTPAGGSGSGPTPAGGSGSGPSSASNKTSGASALYAAAMATVAALCLAVGGF